MFISRPVGLLPKFWTRWRAPLTVDTAVLTQTRRELEKRIVMDDFLSLELYGFYKRRDLQDIYHCLAQDDRRTHMYDLP